MNYFYYLKEWFTQTKPNKFPYFPQKDDEVVYIPYGHNIYNKEVQLIGYYKQSNKSTLIRNHINDIVIAKVIRIAFIFRPSKLSANRESDSRLVRLCLQPIDTQKYGKLFYVTFHDIKDIIDFIVLRQVYESSIKEKWKKGDEFRAIVDNKYWFGTIIGLNKEKCCENSMFQRFRIKWANNETDFLSPWDMERVDESLNHKREESLAITENDRKNFFKKDPNEWPKYDESQELKRLAKGFCISVFIY